MAQTRSFAASRSTAAFPSVQTFAQSLLLVSSHLEAPAQIKVDTRPVHPHVKSQGDQDLSFIAPR